MLALPDAAGMQPRFAVVVPYPGFYFLGLNWLHKYKSALLVGVGEDAAFIASELVTRVARPV